MEVFKDILYFFVKIQGILGTLLGLIVAQWIRRYGKIYVSIESYDIVGPDSAKINIVILFFNTSDTPRGLRDFQLIISTDKQKYTYSTDFQYFVDGHEEPAITLPPKRYTQLTIKGLLNKEAYDRLSCAHSDIIIKYYDHKGRAYLIDQRTKWPIRNRQG